MTKDAFEELRAENPYPELLSGPPLDTIRCQLDQEPRPELPPRPRHGRRVKPLVPIVLSCAVVVAVLIVVVTSGGEHANSVRTTGGRANREPSTGTPTTRSPTAAAAAAYLDLLMPRDGADVHRGAELGLFLQRAQAKLETQCMAKRGLPGPPEDFESSQRFGSANQPNIPAIKAVGNIGVTTVRAPVYPGQKLSPARRRVYDARLSHCKAQILGLLRFENNPAAVALGQSWFTTVHTVIHSSPVQAAMRAGARCSQGTGFPATTAQRETANVEGRITPLQLQGENAKAAAINKQGARVLVRCFGHAEMVQQALLTQRRRAVVAAHAAKIRSISQLIARRVSSLEQASGITFQ